jgi:hypothetical protein
VLDHRREREHRNGQDDTGPEALPEIRDHLAVIVPCMAMSGGKGNLPMFGMCIMTMLVVMMVVAVIVRGRYGLVRGMFAVLGVVDGGTHHDP